MILINHNILSKNIIDKNKNILYIIEDDHYGSNYRDISGDDIFSNLVSIRTKRINSNKSYSLYKDSSFDENYKFFIEDIIHIKSILNKYNTISIDINGYGNYMEKTSPKTYRILCDLLKYNFYFNNKKRIYEKRIPSYSDINKSRILNISEYNPIKMDLIKNKKSISITTSTEFLLGEIIKIKHDKYQEELIGIVTIPNSDISNISINEYNLIEGYTKPLSTGNKHIIIDYVGTIRSNIISFADSRINTINEKPDISDKKEEKTKDTLINTENNYLSISDGYLYEMNDSKIINKFKVVDYYITEVFDTTFLFIKEIIYGQDRISIIKFNGSKKNDINKLMKSQL